MLEFEVCRQSSGEGNGTPLQYSCLENLMDGGAWWAAVHGVAKSHTWLSDFTFTFHFHALEKEMATHSSVLAWRIPGMGEPGGLPSIGSHRVGHDWSNLAAAAAHTHICIYKARERGTEREGKVSKTWTWSFTRPHQQMTQFYASSIANYCNHNFILSTQNSTSYFW